MEIRATDIIVNRGLPLEKEPDGLINKIPSKKKWHIIHIYYLIINLIYTHK